MLACEQFCRPKYHCDGPASPDPDTPPDRRCGSHRLPEARATRSPHPKVSPLTAVQTAGRPSAQGTVQDATWSDAPTAAAKPWAAKDWTRTTRAANRGRVAGRVRLTPNAWASSFCRVCLKPRTPTLGARSARWVAEVALIRLASLIARLRATNGPSSTDALGAVLVLSHTKASLPSDYGVSGMGLVARRAHENSYPTSVKSTE